MKFNKKNELIVNDILREEDEIANENIKQLAEKLTIFAGAIAITHGVLNADSTFFCAGMIIETAGITSLQCTKLRLANLNNNRKTLIRTMYHRK